MYRELRLAFVGSSSLGLRVLTAAYTVPGVKVVGVVSAPKEFKISYSASAVTNVLHTDFSQFCEENSIPLVLSSRGFSDLSPERVFADWKPDLFLVAGWYHMIPSSWRMLAPFLGIHASLLPRYSGGAPLVWALINGETETGVTIFLLDDGVDSGPILGQESFRIEADDDIGALLKKAEVCATSLARSTLELMAQGKETRRAQDEAQRTVFPQRRPEDGRIDTGLPAAELLSFIRAQTKPYPGAFFESDLGRLHVWSGSLVVGRVSRSKSGKFVSTRDGLYFVAQDGQFVELKDVSFSASTSASLDHFIQAFSQGRL